MDKLRTAISIGFIGLILTFLFGGWSTLIAAVIVGAMTGLNYGQRSRLKNPADLGREALLPGLVASAVTVAGSLIHLFIVRPTTGKNILYNFSLNFLEATAPMEINSILVLVISSALALAIGPGLAFFFASTQGLTASARTRQTLIALGSFLLIFPFFEQVTNLGWIGSLISVQIYILLALGLNIVVGYAGLLDLGYAAFFAIGAYTTALLNSPRIDVQWSFWLVIWVAAAVAAVAGLVLGAPTLPLRGDYLAIVTLGFGEIVPVVFRNLIQVTLREPFTRLCFVGCDPKVEPVAAMQTCFYRCDGILNLTGGEAGINPIGQPLIPGLSPNFFGSSSYLPWYFLILVLIVFSIFLIRRLRDSRLGRAWMAIREDELAASQMGIDPVKTKLLAFAMGAAFSGFAGAFYAAYIGAIFPSVFDFSVSVIILCMVILGGLGNMNGVIVGAILIIGTDKLLLPRAADILKGFMKTSVVPSVSNPALQDFLVTSLDPNQMRLALFGIVLVTMMLVRPEGLVPSAERKAEFHAGDESAADKKLAPVGATDASGA